MSQSAFIRFVKGSGVSSLSLDELKEQLYQYQEQTTRTGKQLGWTYEEAAFPYTIETKTEGENRWFYLKGKNEKYRYMVLGTDTEERDEEPLHYVQVVLPEGATHGDKAKANELCKYIAKKLQAELQLFNGRTMYFNPRK
ncbi:DUF1885 family protein [Marinicrinis sediminis]|uniref:DUF1885 family protein n=1 Tax=Marinicrinis sediminis TaxID=1652465 RepID=A0ABW5R6A6_9BACL